MIPFINFDEDFLTTEDLLFLAGASGGNLNEYTATGNPATFSTNVAKPLKSLLIPWTPTQAGSGDPSPENVRPISGVSSLTVYRTGKNLFDETVVNGDLSIDGTATLGNGSRLITSDFIPLGAGTYTITNKQAFPCAIYVYAENKESSYIYAESKVLWNESPATITLTGMRWLRFKWKNADGTAIVPTDLTEIQIELGEASTYTPYTGQSYPVTFPAEAGIVYGGNLTVYEDGSGKLVVDMAEVNMGTMRWSYVSSSGRSLFTTLDLAGVYKNSGSGAVACNALFELYKNVPMSATFKNGEAGLDGDNSHRVVVCDNRYADASAFTTAMSGVQLVYELATPIEYTLSAERIKTLIGVNNIWTDTNGSNTAVYLKRG